MLLREIQPAVADIDILAAQLTAALDGSLMLHLPTGDLSSTDAERMRKALVRGWVDLITRVCEP